LIKLLPKPNKKKSFTHLPLFIYNSSNIVNDNDESRNANKSKDINYPAMKNKNITRLIKNWDTKIEESTNWAERPDGQSMNPPSNENEDKIISVQFYDLILM